MAREFNVASAQSMSVASTPLTVLPFTVSAWVYPFSAAPGTDRSIFAIGSDASNWWRLLQEGDIAGQGPLRWAVRAGTTINAQSAGNMIANTWQHCCGKEVSVTERYVYLGGTNDKATNTTSRSPSAPDQMHIGERVNGSDKFDGRISHVALWSIALTDGEVDSLAAGASPLSVRRDSLVSYWPLNGRNIEVDVVGSHNMTLLNAPPFREETNKMFCRYVVAP